MPKQLRFEVVGFPPEVADRWYLARVVDLKRDPTTKGVNGTFEHLHRSQEGNVRSTVLPMPVRPRGRTGRFFQACGCSTDVGATIVLRDVVGKVIKIRMGQTADGGLDVVAFKRSV